MIMMLSTFKLDNVGLRAARDRMGHSRRALGTAVGVTEQTINSWESGKRPIPQHLPMTLGFLCWKETIISQIEERVVETIDLNLTSEHILSSALPLPLLYQILAAIAQGTPPDKNPRNDYELIDKKLVLYRRNALHGFIDKHRELFLGLSPEDMYKVELGAHRRLAKLLADRFRSDSTQDLVAAADKEIKAGKA